jgi:hypothetical protein
MFPLRLPAPLCEHIGDVAVLEIAQDTLYYAYPVGQHQGQPMTIAGFAISKSDAAEHAAQGQRRRRCPEYRGDVWSLVGMQDLNSDGLLQRTLPAIASLFGSASTPQPLICEGSLAICSITVPLYVLANGGISTGLIQSSSFAEKIR